ETSRLFSLPFACGNPVDAFATEICQVSAPPAPPASAAPPAAAPPAYRFNLRFTLTVSLPASVVVVLVLARLIYAIYVRDCSFLELFCRIACRRLLGELRDVGDNCLKHSRYGLDLVDKPLKCLRSLGLVGVKLAQGRYVSSSITPGCEKVCCHLRMEGMEAGVDRLLLRLVALREGHPLQD
ncbi:hypothetical protein B296_00051464, partial [Ensete ventricosum]